MAVPALAAVAACSDSFPPVPGPLDRFYFPVGLAVRRLPAGNTALLVVSANFDLRYDFDVGGSVLAVDPDASGNTLAGDPPTLTVLGGLNIGSFGGEVDYLAGSGVAWPNELPGHACEPLVGLLAPGAAKVVTTSRGKQLVYAIDMDAQGRLACDGCATSVPTQALDPYDVTAVCSRPDSGGVARAYVTHLRATDSAGLLTEIDLLGGGSTTLFLGPSPTFSATFDPGSPTASPPDPGGRLFVTSQIAFLGQMPLRWFNALATPADQQPALQAHNVGVDVLGAVTRQFVVYRDPPTNTVKGYLRLDLFDYNLASLSGIFVTTGGALAVYDLTPNAWNEPSMQLLRMVPTCNGSGQLRVLPRPGAGALLAMTCDGDGTLMFYDDEVGAMVGRIGLDPSTGNPLLGYRPFGLAVEPREAGRCLRDGNPCTRLYVAAFDSSWINVVEMDVSTPADATIVKRIGRGR